MGHQPFFLLVLGIVVVGLAVVVGINAFSENRIKSNADALVTDGLRIASDVQAWALELAPVDGGADAGLAAATFAAIGYPAAGTGPSATYITANGSFRIGARPAPLEICVHPEGSFELVINAWNEDTGNCVVIGISGTSANDIVTSVAYGD